MTHEYGQLIQWNAKRAFGFIRPDGNGSEDVFLHLSALKNPEELAIGKRVSFQRVKDSNGRRDKGVNAVIMLPVP